MQEQLRELITRHCDTLAEEMEAVRTCIDRFDDPSIPVGDVINEGIELTHKIKGSSGSIGFPEISAASACLEHYLRSLATEAEEIDQEARETAAAHFQTLERLVAVVKPESSTLYNAQFPA